MSTAPPLSTGLWRAEPAVQAVRDQERPGTIISAISDYTRESLKVAVDLESSSNVGYSASGFSVLSLLRGNSSGQVKDV
jgi:hypothetical protein